MSAIPSLWLELISPAASKNMRAQNRSERTVRDGDRARRMRARQLLAGGQVTIKGVERGWI
jgi:hypothetical protein